MSLFGSKTNASGNSQLFGFRAMTSINGSVIPVIIGMQRIAGNVLDALNWNHYQIEQSGKGGKGSGGGKGGADANLGYKTDLVIGVAMGPAAGIDSIERIWLDKTEFAANKITEPGTIPSGPPYDWTPGQPYYGRNYGVARVSPYSVSANDFGNPAGPQTLTGDQYHPKTQVTGTPAAGQYSVNPITGVYTFAAADAGQSIVISYSFYAVTPSTTGSPTANLNLVFFNGATGQSPWAHLVSNNADHAIGYSQIAYVGIDQSDLGSSGNVSNYSFEVKTALIASGCFYPPVSPGSQPQPVHDCNPRDIVVELLTNQAWGVLGWDPLWIPPSVTDNWANYCYANCIFLSAILDSQRSAADWLTDIFQAGNCAPVWSEGVLKCRPYGDLTAVGNGKTFLPETAPVYDLDDDYFLVSSPGDESLVLERDTIVDAYNAWSVEWANRASAYNFEPLAEQDDYSIGKTGRRDASPLRFSFICEQPVAQSLISVTLKDGVFKRNGPFKFSLPIIFAALEPMDLVTITVAELGYSKFPVRILELTEDADLTITITAEEFPWGTAQPTLHPKQNPAGPPVGYYADPGLVNPPLFFEATSEMTQGKNYVLDIALSGGIYWGGCTVWVSRDGGATYQVDGVHHGASTMGTLSANFAAGSDPDISHTLSVNLIESLGVLDSYSIAQADKMESLAVVDQELIAFTNAALTAFAEYDLDTYVRRGVYGSTLIPHLTGAPFARLDGTEYQFQYFKEDIGTTLWFKFTSVNQAGQLEQLLSMVTPYPRTIDGGEARPPFPWQPAQVPAYDNGFRPFPPRRDPLADPAFTLQQFYPTNTDKSVTPVISIFGFVVPNVFSKLIQAPIIVSVVAVVTVGGVIIGAGQTLVLSASAVDANADSTSLGNYGFVTLPNDGLHYSLAVTVIWDANTAKGYFFAGPEQDRLRFWLEVTGTPSPVTVGGSTAFVGNGVAGPPDAQCDRLVTETYAELHAGVWGGAIASVTGGGASPKVLHISGVTWTTNDFAGTYVILLSRKIVNGTASTSRVEELITSNTANTITLWNNTANFLAGDAIAIRATATTYSPTTIGCSHFLNSGSVGNVPDGEIGARIVIVRGTGAHQPDVFVISNTSTTYTVNPEFSITPDATSVFIVINAGGQPEFETSEMTVTQYTSKFFPVSLHIPNTPFTWYVRVLTEDSTGLRSRREFSPWLEFFLWGDIGLPSSDTVTWGAGIGGALTTGTNVAPLYVVPIAGMLISANIIAKTAPVGADLIFDILADGVSLFGGSHLVLPAGATTAHSTAFASTPQFVTVGQVLTLNVLQVGSTTAGQDVTIQLLLH